MKRQLIYLVFVGLVLSSCGPVYKCGDPRPATKPGGGNRFVALLEERDELCDDLKEKEAENIRLTDRNVVLEHENDSLITRTGELKKEYAQLEDTHNKLIDKHDQLNREHINLGERYSAMMSDNFQRGYYFEEQLKNRERKLIEKEKELAERQKRIEELERIIAEQDSIAKRLNRLLREALLGFKSDELTIEIKNGRVYISMSDKLMFQSGSAKVESKGKEALAILARVLNQNTEFDILIEGHTDNVPISTSRYKDNWDLSVDRATSMVRILADEHNVKETRLTAAGRGEFMPRASNDNAEGRAQNRRTEIILSPKLDELMNIISE
jgi:chemotaxis protein MotB